MSMRFWNSLVIALVVALAVTLALFEHDPTKFHLLAFAEQVESLLGINIAFVYLAMFLVPITGSFALTWYGPELLVRFIRRMKRA